RDLRLAHDELRAVLDLLVLVGEAERQRVARVIGPLDDIDELFLEEVDDRHRGSMLGAAPRGRAEALRESPRARCLAAPRGADSTSPGPSARRRPWRASARAGRAAARRALP